MQVFRLAIHQPRLGPTQRVFAERAQIESDALDPFIQEPRILANGRPALWSTLPSEQQLPRPALAHRRYTFSGVSE